MTDPSNVPTYSLSNRHRWSIVILLFLASMINYMDRATLSISLPLVSRDLGLGPASKGILLSAFFWSYAFMQVPIGLCADRMNLRWLYAVAFTLWSLAQGLTGFSGTLGTLIALRILLGIGESIYLPGGTKIVSLFFSSKERGLPSGLFDMGTRTGLVLDGILIPWLIAKYGWRQMFMIVGFTALIWLIPWFLIYPKRLPALNPRPGSASTDIGVKNHDTAPTGSGKPGGLRITVNRNLLGICLGFFCFDYYWYLLVTWLPDYLVTVRGLTILTAGFYASLPYFVFGISEPIGGWLADRLIRFGWDETRTRKGMVTFAFSTGLLLLPAVRVDSPGAAVMLIIGGSLVGLATGNLLVILQSCAPPLEIGAWTGMENFVGNLAGILAPLATGFLIEKTGSYAPGFGLAVFVLLAGLGAYWFIVGDLRSPKHD